MSKDVDEVKGIIDQIKSNIGQEALDKVEDSLISVVSKAESLATSKEDMEHEVKKLRAESMERRYALRDYKSESESKFRDYEEEINNLKNDSSNDETKEELERLRGFEKETIESQRNDFKSFIENVKEHDNFGKASGRFKLPTNDDGIDFEGFAKMDYNDLKHNLGQMKDLKDLDYFGGVSTKKNTPPGGGKSERGTDASFKERIAQAKNQKEITAIMKEEGVT